MADRTVEQRIDDIERMMADKTLHEHFREQAELIDRRLAAQDMRFEAIDQRFSRVEKALIALRRDAGLILAKLAAM